MTHDIHQLALPDKPDEDTEQLFAEIEKLKVLEGVEFDPASLKAHEFLERKISSPSVLFDEPVPWKFWKRVRRRIRRSSTFHTPPELRESREPAIRYCSILIKNKIKALSPFRAQQELYDSILLSIPSETPIQQFCEIMAKLSEAMRAFKDACYIEFQAEYMGRHTG